VIVQIFSRLPRQPTIRLQQFLYTESDKAAIVAASERGTGYSLFGFRLLMEAYFNSCFCLGYQL
jgi:hypothetical protein